jgi:hypothetical protein
MRQPAHSLRQPLHLLRRSRRNTVGASCFSRGKERFSAPEKNAALYQCDLALGPNSGGSAANDTRCV